MIRGADDGKQFFVRDYKENDLDNIFNNVGFKNQEINNQFPVMNIIEPMLEDPCKMMKTTWLVL